MILVKYDVLSEFMSEKSDRIRGEHDLVDYHNDKYNQIKHQVVIEHKELAKEELFDQMRARANTTDVSKSKVPLVRASFIAKKPMNNSSLYSLGLQSVLESNQENYDNMIGYIDPLGVFWINNKEGFDSIDKGMVIEQLRISQNSIFELNPIQRWKNEMRIAFNILTDILLFEINKNKWGYRHQQNFVMKILRWNSDFENEFDTYFDNTVDVSIDCLISLINYIDLESV